MRKRQYLISKGIGVIISLLLVTVSILMCGQTHTVISNQEKTKKTEKISTQEIRRVRDVHKQSGVLNNEDQPKNRLPVFLLFLLLPELIWECNSKCQWFGHKEFRKKTCFYSNVSKRRGPPLSVALF